jgi:hypothetical protein
MPAEAPPAPPPAAPSPNAAPPAPPPAAEHERPTSEFMGDIEADFTDLDAGKPVRQRDETGKFRTAPKENPAAEAPTKPVEAPPEAQAKPKEGEQTPALEEKKPTRMRELGQAYDDLKKKISTEYEPKIQSLAAKLKELETKQPQDTAPVLAKLKTLEKRNAELEQHMGLVDYEKTSEYQTKYVQPFNDQWARTQAIFDQLEVTERIPDGVDDMGEPKFREQPRPATPEDLLELARLPLGKMAKRTKELFGESSSLVLNQIVEIGKLWEVKERAKKEAATKATEWQAQRGLEFQNRQKTLANAWTETNKELEEKFPKAFKAEEANADDKAAHTKGFAVADLLFLGNQALTPEQIEALPNGFKETVKAGQPLSEVQKVQLHALARLKMANHDRLVARVKARDARIAELEKSLADYEKSEPSAEKAGEGGKVGDKDFFAQVEEDLEKLDRR